MNTPGPSAAFLHGLAQRLELTGLVHVRAPQSETTQILRRNPTSSSDWSAQGELARRQDVPTSSSSLPAPFRKRRAGRSRRGRARRCASGQSRDEAVLAYCVQAQAESLEADATAAPTIVEELRTAVERGELRLLYQPEYDLSTRRVVAAEALIRWHHPQRGDLEPGEFRPGSRASGLIRPIGEWVIRTAVSTLAYWRQARPQLDLGLRINISPVQMTGTDVCDQLESALLEHDVPGSQISIELTEHEPPQDLHEGRHPAPAQVTGRDVGDRRSRDRLQHPEPAAQPAGRHDQDRPQPGHRHRHRPRAQSIVTAMIGLALNFDLGVVAEGVGTRTRWRRCSRSAARARRVTTLSVPADRGRRARTGR